MRDRSGIIRKTTLRGEYNGSEQSEQQRLGLHYLFLSMARFWQTAKERDFQEVRALLYESLCKGYASSGRSGLSSVISFVRAGGEASKFSGYSVIKLYANPLCVSKNAVVFSASLQPKSPCAVAVGIGTRAVSALLNGASVQNIKGHRYLFYLCTVSPILLVSLALCPCSFLFILIIHKVFRIVNARGADFPMDFRSCPLTFARCAAKL